jgi:hypothetical protein
MPWALNDAKTKVEGNTVTIEPWVPFGTANYVISVDGYEPFLLNTAVGAPADAFFDYEKPYYFEDTTNKAGVAPTLVVTDAKGVKLTSGYSVYYEIVTAEPTGYAYVDGTSGLLSLYADPTYAAVKATISYTDADGKTQSFSVVTEETSCRKPVETVNAYLEATAVVPTAKLGDTEKADKIVWGSTAIKIGDSTAQVVGLIKTSEGNSYSINNWSVGTKNETKTVLNTVAVGAGYTFKYTSTDSSKVIVDENDGTLVGVTETNGKPAYILVTMSKPNASGTLTEVGIVAAVPVEVQAKKAAAVTTLDKPSAILLTAGSFTTVTVTPTTKNQYGEEMADTIKEVSATFNGKTHYILKDKTAADNIKSVTINAADVNTYFNAGSNVKAVNLTYKVVMNSGKSADFLLTLKEVQAANVASQEYKLDVKGAEVKADKLNDVVKVGVVSKVLGEKYGNANFFYGKVDANVAKEGDLYVVVYDQDRKVVTPATTGALTVGYKESAAVTTTASTTALQTLAAGVYTVELYKVTKVVANAQGKVVLDTRIDVQTYNVTTNALPSVATNISYDLNKKVLAVGADGTVTLAEGAVTFKFNDAECKGVDGGKFDVVKTTGVTVGTSNKVFVYEMTVRYTLDKGYIEFTVPVNKTFTR